jgi:hypothetical protein
MEKACRYELGGGELRKHTNKEVMTMPARLARAALSGAIFFVVYWAVYSLWEESDHDRIKWAAIGAMIVAVLAFLRTYMIERLERRSANAPRPTLRSILDKINTIIRKSNS